MKQLLIRTGPASSMAVDDLKIAHVFLKMVIREMGVEGFEIPADLAEDKRLITSELDQRLRDARARKLELAKKRRYAMTPNSEKLQMLDAEIADLERQLGITQATTPGDAPAT